MASFLPDAAAGTFKLPLAGCILMMSQDGEHLGRVRKDEEKMYNCNTHTGMAPSTQLW